MTDLPITAPALFQTGVGALVALTLSALLQRWAPIGPSRKRSANTPPPIPVQQFTPPPMPVQARPSAILAIKAIADQFADAANDDGRRLDARGNLERAPRPRQLMAHAKILEKFMDWMIAEGFSGWYTPALVYEAFQEFAWQAAVEEIDYRSFLSYLVAMPGVQKKRAYVKRNETFRHLRAVTNGQERAVVYRIPTAQELAAVRHRAALAAAEVGLRRPVSGRQKTRLTPGGREQSHSDQATRRGAQKPCEFSAPNVDAPGLVAAA